jgi:uncharacterized protein (TIGR02246 family)
MIAACNQAPMSADPSVITSRSDAWEAALNAKDIDALVELYATDARILPPNGKMQTGRDAVRAAFGGMIDAGLGGELTSIETRVVGDIGYNVGTYALTADGATVDTGKFIEIWHRGDDGQWRYANDIWNSDAPVAMAEAPHSHLMIVHDVDDGDHWLAAWRGDDSRHKLFEANGAAHVHAFQNPDNPNQTGLVVAVTDMDAINAMLQSEEGQAAAKADGVKMDSIVMLTEAK